MDGRGEVVEMEELGGRIVLAEPLAESGRQRASEVRRAVGRHRHDRPQHGHRPAGALPTPPVGHRLGGGELPGVDELDVGSQDGVLGERHRVVRPGAVDHRRRHEHEVVGVAGDRLGERLVDPLGDVLPAAGAGVGIAGAEVDDDVDRPGRRRQGDRRVGLEAGEDASAEVALGAADRHGDRSVSHVHGHAHARRTVQGARTLVASDRMSDGQPPAERPGDDDPQEPPNPFAGLPLFGDLAKALAGQGPLNWDAARQFAVMGATGGDARGERQPRAALRLRGPRPASPGMHVADVIGLSHELGEVRAVTRSQWATETLEAYRHLFTEMAASLGRAAETRRRRAATTR